MKIIQINEKYSKVIPDKGKLLRFKGDDNLYSEIVCKTDKIFKIEERNNL